MFLHIYIDLVNKQPIGIMPYIKLMLKPKNVTLRDFYDPDSQKHSFV